MRITFVMLLLMMLSCGMATSFSLGEASIVRYSGEVQGDHSWQGQAAVHSLTLEFDPASVAASLTLDIIVLARDFDSGNWLRDQNARRAVFEVGQYPEIRLSVASTSLQELPEGITETNLTGVLELHGVSQTITLPIMLDYSGDSLEVTGAFDVSLSAFTIKAPSVLGRTVADSIDVEFEIIALAD